CVLPCVQAQRAHGHACAVLLAARLRTNSAQPCVCRASTHGYARPCVLLCFLLPVYAQIAHSRVYCRASTHGVRAAVCVPCVYARSAHGCASSVSLVVRLRTESALPCVCRASMHGVRTAVRRPCLLSFVHAQRVHCLSQRIERILLPLLTMSGSEYDTSLPPLPTGEYEVFLSFRGPDVRLTFADCLYTCLVRAKIRTFRDEEELQKGETMGESLIQAITESKVYIPILTQDYASSKWCLQELAKMVDCWKNGGGAKGQHIILPVFYLMDPRGVRHPDSGPYEEAFEQHSLKHDPETILEWKEALREVGKMKGWHVTQSDG
ncbi:Disease resistance protein L6, partial [Linum grandiflorum]